MTVEIAITPLAGALLYSRAPTSNWNPSPWYGLSPSPTTTVPPSHRKHINEAVHPVWDECDGSLVHRVQSRYLRSPLYAGKIQGRCTSVRP